MADFKQNYFQRRTKDKGPRSNNRISAPEVQVIGSGGENIGIINTIRPIIKASIPSKTCLPVVMASKNRERRIREIIVEIQIIFLKAFSVITYLSFSSKISTENSA